VGVGLDAGEAAPVEGGLRGTALNLAARLCAAAAPGDVLVSETVTTLARKVEGLAYEPRGAQRFKGFDEPVAVFALVAEERAAPDSPGPGPEDMVRQAVGGFLGAVPAGQLVGRSRELRALEEALLSVRDDHGRLVLLSGEAGVGKTRLAQELASAATHNGYVVATGRCYDQRSGVPFYPFLEALAAAYRLTPPALRSAARSQWPDLARLLPEQLGVPAPRDLSAPQEQEVLFSAVSSFLLALAGTSPIALLLDDLQWADSASLDLLQHLARRTRAAPVFILATRRESEVDWEHPLEAALRNLHREGLIETIRLSRLDRAGTSELIRTSLGSDVTPTVPALIHQYSAGNPFFTRELLQALVERGDVQREDDGWRLAATTIAVPDTVMSAVGERLAHLDEPARDVLRQVSVLGATFTFTDLVVMNQLSSGRSEEVLEAALDRATESKLLAEAGQDGYTFSHALVQQAIYAGLSGHRKRRLHRLAAEALERGTTGQVARRAGEIAWHFVESGERRKALGYLLLAGEEAERLFAYAEAERFYRQALDMTRALAGPDVDLAAQADARRRLGRVLKNLASYEDALRMLEEADRLYRRSGDLAAQIWVAAEIGNVNFLTGALEQGIERIERLLAEINGESLAPARAAAAYLPLAHLHMASLQTEASLDAAERAVELATAAGEDRIRAQAQAIRGEALRVLGRQDEALGVLRDAVELARSLDDTDAEFLALDAVAELLVERGELHESERYRRQAVALVERISDPAKIAWELTSLGHLMYCVGRWRDARRLIASALESSASLAPSRVTAYALIRLATCDLGEGRWEEARLRLEEAVALSREVASLATEKVGQQLLAELDLRTGQPEHALARLERSIRSRDVPQHWRWTDMSLAAWAYLLLGDRHQARAASEQSLDAARAGRDRVALLDALRIAGMVAAHDEDWDRAEALLDEAVDLAHRMPFPYSEARSLEIWGTLDHRRGRLDSAQHSLERACALFEDLGAARDAESCRRELANIKERAH
jgi:tetratricopeptide (TPR) repeat protein